MKKKKWLVAIAVVLLLLGGLIHHGSRHVSTGPAEGVAIHQAAQGQATETPQDRPTLRIATFNIHAGKGRDGRRDLDRVADCLGGLDFVALNEVRGPQTFENCDQAERLGRQLGMAWLFTPAVRTWYHLESGNGLLSRVPVTFWQRIPLARQYDRSHRNAVLLGLKHRDRTIHVLLTHVNRRYDAERRAQLRAVIALYLALAEPAILLGDMNSDTEDPQIRQLLQTPGVSDPVSAMLGLEAIRQQAPQRIDWIFARGLDCVDAGIIDTGASDHPMIWAELRLPPDARPEP
ncbi:MAG: endonuclease/exonuclease/phosphatase family protein [Pirellulales bacterium]|nr:endonuclease/exonuclease/phosphatase family protein [Pirellulales bacterium]